MARALRIRLVLTLPAKRVDMRSHAANNPNITQAGVTVHGILRAYEFLDGKAK